ncbi:probable RNA-binding protein 18 [Mercenaria mercenaria]|uniref:probable RNA-binding protein 18 n=1 Tax=Mercenaria mercenaria TaxID=6596 RepID=UPI00234E48FD|nr:probable RNA-binding protein 18 [Mercenaria mercenaria]
MAEGDANKFVRPKLQHESSASDVIPIPDDPVDCSEENDRRLWIGNLDTRVTEFALLKILQKFGSLQRFDFLYHKTGPDQGKPRGYCFVSYSCREEAEKAMKCLDKKLALSKRMVVRWAQKEEDRDQERPGEKGRQSELSTNNLSSESKIRAIEMKLKNMERCEPDFNFSSKPAALPGTSKYSSAHKNQQGTSQKMSGSSSSHRVNSKQVSGSSHRDNSKPYFRKDGRR